jgi:hypothetical protein
LPSPLSPPPQAASDAEAKAAATHFMLFIAETPCLALTGFR